MSDMVGTRFAHVLGMLYMFGERPSMPWHVLIHYAVKKVLNMHKTFYDDQHVSRVWADTLHKAQGTYVKRYPHVKQVSWVFLTRYHMLTISES